MIIGYPLVIYAYVIYFHEKNSEFEYDQIRINNIHVCVIDRKDINIDKIINNVHDVVCDDILKYIKENILGINTV